LPSSFNLLEYSPTPIFIVFGIQAKTLAEDLAISTEFKIKWLWGRNRAFQL
jgi:hypothetical protein